MQGHLKVYPAEALEDQTGFKVEFENTTAQKAFAKLLIMDF